MAEIDAEERESYHDCVVSVQRTWKLGSRARSTT